MFWPNYPWWNHIFPSHFDSYPFERDPIPIPKSTYFLHISHPLYLQTDLLLQVCQFLSTYFSQQPKLTHTPNTLLCNKDHLFVLCHNTTHDILATIRYHYLGLLYSSEFKQPPIYIVDAFCVHPEWRSKGLGTYLLTELHRYANYHNIPYAFFLKEGSSLPTLPLPIHSGSYVYRPLQELSSITLSTKIVSLTSEEAQRWIKCYMEIRPDTFLIYHPHSINAIWKAYLSPPFSILVCFQDTHQIISTPRSQTQKMGWATVWLENPLITDSIRHEASILLTDSVSNIYQWIWMNHKWTGKNKMNQSPWREDGGFHWYTYQWNTNRRLDQSYGIMIN